ncbi:MAG: P-loop NTPase [Erysipelotrichaceae bacterium]|nr:P-loop NTPase [Erysipelotrichaceae bacterium]
MSECSHNCSSCSANCDHREIEKEQLNDRSQVKKVIGIVSGKGGVGKSLVSSLLAINMQKKGYRTGIIDADITGPSIPRIFGVTQKAYALEDVLLPNRSALGVQVMSVNMLLDDEETPVVWRGPVIAGMVKQFYTDVLWEDVDYLFVDMPPGTADVPLTVFQSLPVDGIVIVTSPQDLVSMIVMKAVNMAKMMNVPILGIVENMSYFACPDCGKKIQIFGESHIDEIASEHDLQVLAKLPMNPEIAKACDEGRLEEMDICLPQASAVLEDLLKDAHRIAIPTEDHLVFQHFGKTEVMTVYDVESGVVTNKRELKMNGTGHGAIARLLQEEGVDLLICGGIGAGAITALQQANISVIRGVTGDIDVAIRAYLNHELIDDETKVCSHHEEDHDCGNHKCC